MSHPSVEDTFILGNVWNNKMATIEEVYEELNYPPKRKLAMGLNARRIPFTSAQLEDLTRKSEVRQIFGPPPKYEGKMTSVRMNERWQADLADMTSKPWRNVEDHILFVFHEASVGARHRRV